MIDVRYIAALLCLLCALVGYIVGRDGVYSPLAEREMMCSSGLETCSYGLAKCSAKLEQYEEWAQWGRERKLIAFPMGPTERQQLKETKDARKP